MHVRGVCVCVCVCVSDYACASLYVCVCVCVCPCVRVLTNHLGAVMWNKSCKGTPRTCEGLVFGLGLVYEHV